MNTELRYRIADWFMNKNIDKVTTAHCICFSTFGKEDIIKESEKALYIELGMRTNAGAETAYTKKLWVPKSVVSTYEI